MIFTDYLRTDNTPKKNGESTFAFLDRSARPEMRAVREFTEALGARYPATDMEEMVARIRSGDDTQFRSAGFELMVYEFLTRQGYRLIPHPELNNGSSARPDFHVVGPDGSEFYLEAVLATEDKGQNASADAMIGTTFDILDSIPHPNFWIGITSKGQPTTQPSGRRLQRQVMHWLNSLDPDEVLKTRTPNFFDTAPTFKWTHEDWDVEIQAIAVSPDRRGLTKRLIAIADGKSGTVDSWTPIRSALKAKGQHYGELALPLLVAVNFSEFNLSPIDEMQALYGEEQFSFSLSDTEAEPQFSRAVNGLWIGPSGPRGKRVSGAWLFNDLTVYTAARRKQTVYFNPWANHQLPDVLKHLPHATVEDSKIKRTEGLSLREVFRLPKNWPEDSAGD